MPTSDTFPSNADVDDIGRYPAGVVVIAALVATGLAELVGLLIAGVILIGPSL